MTFANSFENHEQDQEDDDILHSDDEEESLTSGNANTFEKRIAAALTNPDISLADQESLVGDMERMLRMFYLEMRVKNMLNEYKNDYFV